MCLLPHRPLPLAWGQCPQSNLQCNDLAWMLVSAVLEPHLDSPRTVLHVALGALYALPLLAPHLQILSFSHHGATLPSAGFLQKFWQSFATMVDVKKVRECESTLASWNWRCASTILPAPYLWLIYTMGESPGNAIYNYLTRKLTVHDKRRCARVW